MQHVQVANLVAFTLPHPHKASWFYDFKVKLGEFQIITRYIFSAV